jgi:hypothetical protein
MELVFFPNGSTALAGPWPLLQSRNHLFTDGRTPWTSYKPVERPLPTHRTTQTQNKRIYRHPCLVGFEPTIPAFERAKTVHALDRTATVIGHGVGTDIQYDSGLYLYIWL